MVSKEDSGALELYDRIIARKSEYYSDIETVAEALCLYLLHGDGDTLSRYRNVARRILNHNREQEAMITLYLILTQHLILADRSSQVSAEKEDSYTMEEHAVGDMVEEAEPGSRLKFKTFKAEDLVIAHKGEFIEPLKDRQKRKYSWQQASTDED